MNSLDEFFHSRQTIPSIKAQNAVAFVGPVPDLMVWTPCPTACLAQSLCLRMVSLTPTQLLLRPLALDPLRDRVGNRCERAETGLRKWMTREHRHHADHPILDNQRVSGEGNHSVILCPALIMQAWIVYDVIGEMRLLLPGNQADLQVSDVDPAV